MEKEKETLLTVGIDLGTSTTQLILSELTVENFASAFTVPRIEISDKKVRIFAVSKQTETGDCRNGKRQLGNFRPAKAFNEKRGNVRLRYRRKHKNEIFRLSPTVE